MASVMKLTSSAAGKLVMRQGVLQALRGAASQVKLANAGEEVSKSEAAKSEEVQKKVTTQEISEAHDLYIHKTRDELKVSLENVHCNSLQGDMVDKLGPYLKTTVTEEKVPNVMFNHVAEEVYLNSLYMTFKKMGYSCSFSRYNGDKGVASFHKVNTEEQSQSQTPKYSFFRSGKPNVC